MTDRQPWFRFYAADWRGDANLRNCSLAARGLWADCMTLMHEAQPRGFLMFAGEALSVEQIALLVSRPLKEVRLALAELERAGVPSRDERGVIYSRRMVRDTERSESAVERGSRGGNPKLLVKPNGVGRVIQTQNQQDKHAGARTRDLGSDLSRSSTQQEEGEREREPAVALATARFETFWTAYPLKAGKKAAEKAFRKLDPDHELMAVLLDAIERHRAGRQWREGFVPHAATWLNGERWKDEVPSPSGPRPSPRTAPRAVGGWRERCPHEPTCQTPQLCAMAQERTHQDEAAEVPA